MLLIFMFFFVLCFLFGIVLFVVLVGCVMMVVLLVMFVEVLVMIKVVGYLFVDVVLVSLVLVFVLLVVGLVGFVLDEQVSCEVWVLCDSLCFVQVYCDVELGFLVGVNQFFCVIDVEVDVVKMLVLYCLLECSCIDVSVVMCIVKKYYQCLWLFMVNNEFICSLEDEQDLCGNGFYLLGYILIGWVWVLILFEIVLDCVDVILVCGCNYGESWLVCNVYWQSDIFEGCFMGVVVVVCLYGNVVFNKDLMVV